MFSSGLLTPTHQKFSSKSCISRASIFVRTSQRPLGTLPDVGTRRPWWQTGSLCDFTVGWPGWLVGASKALGRVLLEQRVERQKCQREAMNALFQVDNPFSEWIQASNHDFSIFPTRVLLLGCHSGDVQWGLQAGEEMCLQAVQVLHELL